HPPLAYMLKSSQGLQVESRLEGSRARSLSPVDAAGAGTLPVCPEAPGSLSAKPRMSARTPAEGRNPTKKNRRDFMIRHLLQLERRARDRLFPRAARRATEGETIVPERTRERGKSSPAEAAPPPRSSDQSEAILTLSTRLSREMFSATRYRPAARSKAARASA